jgi:uncharacterized protein YkwD
MVNQGTGLVKLRKGVAAVVALGALAAGTFAAAGPDPGRGSGATMDASTMAVAFEWAINVERGHRGLAALFVDGVQAAQARAWSTTMASTNTLAEDPGSTAAIAAYDPAWRLMGENVGVGATPQSLEAAFMASPPHRANNHGAFSHVGVGVVLDNGRIWVTERFYR